MENNNDKNENAKENIEKNKLNNINNSNIEKLLNFENELKEKYKINDINDSKYKRKKHPSKHNIGVKPHRFFIIFILDVMKDLKIF
jgi:hypothetical protein